jgi:hypothetical protein
MNPTTKFKLKVIASKIDERLQVELYTEPITRRDLLPRAREIDPHPFVFLCDGDSSTCFEAVKNGQYMGVFQDNEVLRAIVETMSSEVRLKKAAGKGNWRRLRAVLVKSLDLLWE